MYKRNAKERGRKKVNREKRKTSEHRIKNDILKTENKRSNEADEVKKKCWKVVQEEINKKSSYLKNCKKKNTMNNEA